MTESERANKNHLTFVMCASNRDVHAKTTHMRWPPAVGSSNLIAENRQLID